MHDKVGVVVPVPVPVPVLSPGVYAAPSTGACFACRRDAYRLTTYVHIRRRAMQCAHTAAA